MTLLAALAARYDRMAAEGHAPIPGFAPAKIHYTVVLSDAGEVRAVQAEPRDAKGRIVREVMAPQAPKRTAGVASGTFWDKTSYALGCTAVDPGEAPERQARNAARCAQEHAAFKLRHEALLADPDLDDAGCRALLAFLGRWDPADYDALDHAPEMLDQNVAFRLEGETRFLHDRPAVRAALAGEAAARAGGAAGLCLVTGAVAPIARLHPSIKGVPGAQSSGAALVSFNLDAFNSFGRSQGFNAPVSEAAAEAYGSALNALVSEQIGKDKKGNPVWANRIRLGEDTVVFWADTAEAEAIVRGLLDPPVDDATETQAIRDVLRRIERGERIGDATFLVEPETKVYLLGLSPNAARLSVRFWREGTLGDLAQRFQEHWADMRIEPAPRERLVPVWALLYELAPLRKIDKGLVHLAGEMMRAIVTGSPYPGALLAQALMRMRAEHDASGLRVALIKAVLNRRERKAWEAAHRADPTLPDWKDRWMSLNRDEPNEGYRLGRLFAVLEAAQYTGLGRRVNAGVKDKFFGSASATPRHVFPSLLRGVQDHLSAARKRNRQGRANRLEAEMREILAGFPSPGIFSATLRPEDQGAFVVGYYHQDADLRIPRVKDEIIETAETASDTDEQD
ncbi:type I-C CRISPR-associated protein Cas8c/Csd1 [Methylobacterium sp. Leaf466]|uniref:type I-C CRISPR-associated protein Cas8c/Csd1 n=1 Tax=Methylobacterium sp. Leaf466 TaxID=1736386 RepID=UPI0006FD6E44|nr:type I-C CRISPR-associated protein Cas8c/Csd1 [Methylobacterium sp. Leaf466]KQT85706.1 hypothetical protein ASG59_17820 [Methylobacterium sp. Leaf466]